jgi:hypothetical protein
MRSSEKDHGDAFVRVVDALKSRNQEVTVRGVSAMAQCSAHLDRNPSLSVTDAGDRALIYCGAGCTSENILDALGLTIADLFNKPNGTTVDASPALVAKYIYVDEGGGPLFRKLRYEPKSFQLQGWNGGSWDSTLGDARRVLYGLPQLIAGIAARQWVFVVEGEKDAERLVAEGFVATTIAMGSNPGNWDKTETRILDDAYVAVIGDNDAAGRKYARHVASSLTGRAAEVRLIQLDGLPEKGDVSDWLDSGGTPADLVKILDSTQAWKARRRFDGAEPFATVGDVSAYKADSLGRGQGSRRSGVFAASSSRTHIWWSVPRRRP